MTALVALPAAAAVPLLAGIPEWLLTGGVGGAVAIVIVALIKARGSDRQTILSQQSAHMDRLTAERNEAVKERDGAYDQVEEWRKKWETSERARIVAEVQAEERGRANERANTLIAELNTEVSRLRSQEAR